MFQCSVRDLILITCIAALLVAWSLDHHWQAEADAKLKVAEEMATLATARLAHVESELNLYKYGPLAPVGQVVPADGTQTLELPLVESDL
jgi:hypothetical protein